MPPSIRKPIAARGTGYQAPTLKGFMKSLLRANYVIAPEVRRKQVSQYLGDDPNALPDAKFRPSSLTKYQDQPFKSIEPYLPEYIELPEEVIGKSPDELKLPYKFGNKSLDQIPLVAKGGAGGGLSTPFLPNNMGLGSATTSIGKDEKGNPYFSMFDSWDFEGGEVFDKLIKGLGKPYNIYDRVPINLEEGKIPRYIGTRKYRDIELPRE